MIEMEDILIKIELHREKAKRALLEIQEREVLDSNIFTDFDKIKTVDSFIYRFIKLQDMNRDCYYSI